MGAFGHARQRGFGLALAAGGDDGDAAIGQAQGFAQLDDQAFGHVEMFQLPRDLDRFEHRVAGQGDHAIVRVRRVEHLLHAAEQRCKGRDDDPPRRLAEDLIEGRPDHLLGRCVAGPLAARRIGKERQHTLRAELAQPAEARPAAAHGGIVELEIAGVDDPPGVGGDAQSHAIRDRVRDRQERDLERADAKALAGLDAAQVGAARQSRPFVQPGLDQAARQRGGVDRRFERQHIAQQIGQRADVILVAVGDHDGRHIAGALAQIAEVRDHHVNTPHVVFGEHDPGVNDQDAVVLFEEQHIFADFPQTAEGNQPERVL